MDFTDRATFAAAMQRMGRLVGRNISVDDVEAYYKYLEHYKVETINRAIDKAYRDRDPDDAFLKTSQLTANEIKAAADQILQLDGGEKTYGCQKCIGGWIVMKQANAQPIASRCECLLKRIDEKKSAEKRGLKRKR